MHKDNYDIKKHPSTYDLGPYLNYEEFFSVINNIASDNPDQVDVSTYGYSVENRPLIKIVVNPALNDAPEVLVSSLMHGNEFVGGEVCLSVLAMLLDKENNQLWLSDLRKKIKWTFVPMVNPDAFCANIARLNKNKSGNIRKNANRVDLNRNFPYKSGVKIYHPAAGSKRFKWHPAYRGETPLSEPENKFFVDMIKNSNFQISWSFHSMSGLFLHPSGWTKKECQDIDQFKEIASVFLKYQPHYKYRVLSFRELYPTLGNLDDYLYDNLGIWPVTIECSWPSHLFSKRIFNRFWIMNPINKSVWIKNDCEASLRSIQKALELKGLQK